MKKLYSFVILAAITLSVSALERQQATYTSNSLDPTVLSGQKFTAKKATAMATDTEVDFSKIDTWKLNNHLSDNNGEQEIAISVTLTDPATGKVSISIPDMNCEMNAQYDATAGTLTIGRQVIGSDDYGDLIFYIKETDDSGNLLEGEASTPYTVGTVDGSTITFPKSDIWAIGDPDAENLGFIVLSDENIFYHSTWVSLGTGKFIENIVYPGFVGSENTVAADVEISADGYGNYVVEDPLKALYAEKKINAKSPSMKINATDPSNILIPVASTGMYSDESSYYAYFSESWFNAEMDGEEVEEEFKIKMEIDGDKVTVTFPVNCCTIWLYPTQSFYNGSPYVSTLTFTDPKAGIHNVDATVMEDLDTPVRYYNLQGAAISNPAPGSIVIRVQGNKATKELIR